MQVWQRTATGTVLDRNQDVLRVREDQGLVLLADGRGQEGRELAEQLAEEAERRFLALRAKGRPDLGSVEFPAVLRSLGETVRDWQMNHPHYGTSGVEMAVALVVEGHLLVGRTGSTALLLRTGETIRRLDPVGVPKLAAVTGDLDGAVAQRVARARQTPSAVSAPGECFGELAWDGPFPLQVGDWVFLCSEGVLISQPLEEVIPHVKLFHEDPEGMVEGLFRRASARYDGDDRTLALVRFLPQDLVRRNPPREVVLSHDFNHEFKAPMWVPMAVMAVIGAVGLALSAWLSRFGSDD